MESDLPRFIPQWRPSTATTISCWYIFDTEHTCEIIIPKFETLRERQEIDDACRLLSTSRSNKELETEIVLLHEYALGLEDKLRSAYLGIAVYQKLLSIDRASKAE